MITKAPTYSITIKSAFIVLYAISNLSLVSPITASSFDQGMLAYWPFSGDATDKTANGHHGVPTDVVLVPDRRGQPGSAYQFNGSSSTIRVASTINAGQDLTISYWMRFTPPIAYGSIIHRDNWFNGHVNLGVSSESFRAAVAADSPQEHDIEPYSSPIWREGQWNHIVFVRNSAELKSYVYVNGTLFSEQIKTYLHSPINIAPLQIGAFRWNGVIQRFFNGSIDDIRIYNRALSNAEVVSLHTHEEDGTTIILNPSSQSVTSVSATLGGNAVSYGGATISERGVVYAATAINSNPLIGGSGVTKVSTTGSTGVFTVPVTGLTQFTSYSFKAYAVNSQGTIYSSVTTFTTGPLPTIISPAATAISPTSVVLGANVTNANGLAVIERGVVFSLASSGDFPMIGGSGVIKVNAPGTTGEFTVPVQGLSPGTMYRFSAFATNSGGTVYTNIVQFSTISTNAELASLGVSSTTLRFDFTPASNTKTANVGFGTDGISVIASPAHPQATLEVKINGGAFTQLTSGIPSQFLALTLGQNTIDVRVTAQDGVTQRIYQIAVVRSSNPMVSPPPDQRHKVGQQLESDDSLALVVEGVFTSIEATGLPPGIRLDKTTWSLAGRPTVTRKNSNGVVQPYTVKLRARGASGFGPWVSFPWTIEPIPAGLTGGFEGFAANVGRYNGGVHVTISKSGTVTGYIRKAYDSGRYLNERFISRSTPEKRITLRGILVTRSDGLTGEVIASGKIQSEEWKLTLTLSNTGAYALGRIYLPQNLVVGEEDDDSWTGVSAWRLDNAPIPSKIGTYNIRLRPDDEDFLSTYAVKEPEGDGFARVTISKTGSGRVSGRLPDGSVLNCSGGLGVNGELGVLEFKNQTMIVVPAPNSPSLSLRQTLGETLGTLLIQNEKVSGSLYFNRQWHPTSWNRVHPEGIDLLILAEGGKYSVSSQGLVLGLVPPLELGNTQIILSGGVIPGPSVLSQNNSLGLRNRVSLAPGGSSDNANYVTFSLNAQTGLWSGTFSYDGISARSRRGVFQGLLIPTLNGGFGYQLLGELANPSATPPTTDGNSPQRSGAALFVKMPSTFAHIPGGVFAMGRTSGDADSNAPPINVKVSPFYMQKKETTKAQWDEVRTWAVNNGYTDLPAGAGKAEDHPVHTVTWWDVVKWCNARSEKEGLTPVYTVSGAVMRTGTTEPMANWSANGYRLPTEAEWEKAARGGVGGKRFPWGSDTISHAEAVYTANSSLFSYDTSGYLSDTYNVNYNNGITPITAPAGSFSANAFGLHDMAGNVWEWCWDWYGVSSYVDGATDPRGAPSGSHRVSRGGGWYSNSSLCRAAFRNFNTPSDRVDGRGFRPARSSP